MAEKKKRGHVRTGKPRGGEDRSYANTGPMHDVSREFSALTKACKEMAIKRRARSPVSVEKIPDIIDAFDAYTVECYRTGKPLTFAGYAMAAGMSMDTFDKMKRGDLDYVIDEYRIVHNVPEDAESITVDGKYIPLTPFSDIAQKAALCIQDQLESNCYQLKGNQVGSIFGLKARYGWQDERPERVTTNVLCTADKGQALKALAMLNVPGDNGK